MGFFASVDGRVSPAEQATVSVLDNGFTFGDSVYETLRTYASRPFHLDRHLDRLRASAGRLGIAIPQHDAELARRVDAVLERAANAESYIRLVVSRGVGEVSYRLDRVHGPTVVVLVKPHEPPAAACYELGVEATLSSFRRNHPAALDPAIKSCNLLNNLLAAREAQARGAFEPILLNQAGELAEGGSSNLFLVRSGRLLTPPLSAGILPGITRAVVLELARALDIASDERTLLPDELFGADEAFITSSLKETLPLRAVDGRPIGPGKPGPITQRLLAAFREYAPRHSH
jgi:branched-chain amino acid aminotransferase